VALLLKRKVTLFRLGIDERYIIYCIRVTDVAEIDVWRRVPTIRERRLALLVVRLSCRS
jgi:hypothetical protein